MMGTLQRIIRLPLEVRASRLRGSDLESARNTLRHSSDTTPRERRLLEAVNLDVHARDSMYEPGRGQHYLSVGLSALDCIDAARERAGAPRAVLDFASGYGRVLRFLCVAFPDALITACEINPAAVGFCTRVFGVRGLHSFDRFDRLSFPEQYDLIWCGSLLTHLNLVSAGALLDFFARHLSPAGVCVASAHGNVTLDALRADTLDYGLSQHARHALLAGFDDTGYGYAAYDGQPGYGISVSSPDVIADLAERGSLRVTSLQAEGWDDHHDVYAFRQASP